MKIYNDYNLCDFDFWGAAKENANLLTFDEFEQIEKELENEYPEGIEDVELNDIFRFDFNYIAQLLGYEDEEELYNERENN